MVMTSSDMPSSSSLTTPQPTTITPSLSPEEGVWSKIMVVTQEQATEIERKTRYQSKSLSWYEECHCRITPSFFGGVCRRLSSTLPNSIMNFESAYISIVATALCLGQGQRRQSLSTYKQEWHERGHPSF